MKKIALLAAAAALTGCVTWGQMDDGLRGLIGQPINVAISKIGYPSTEQTIAGRKLYRWGVSRQSVDYMPMVTTTTGYSGVGASYTPNSSTTLGGTYISVDYNCQITLEVDAKEVITGYQYNGNRGGCEPYIKALNKK